MEGEWRGNGGEGCGLRGTHLTALQELRVSEASRACHNSNSRYRVTDVRTIRVQVCARQVLVVIEDQELFCQWLSVCLRVALHCAKETRGFISLEISPYSELTGDSRHTECKESAQRCAEDGKGVNQELAECVGVALHTARRTDREEDQKNELWRKFL
jgi:hypothetical protein